MELSIGLHCCPVKLMRKFGATVWTQYKRFKDLPNMRYFEKE